MIPTDSGQVLRHNLSCHLHVEVVYHGEDEAEAELISQLEVGTFIFLSAYF